MTTRHDTDLLGRTAFLGSAATAMPRVVGGWRWLPVTKLTVEPSVRMPQIVPSATPLAASISLRFVFVKPLCEVLQWMGFVALRAKLVHWAHVALTPPVLGSASRDPNTARKPGYNDTGEFLNATSDQTYRQVAPQQAIPVSRVQHLRSRYT